MQRDRESKGDGHTRRKKGSYLETADDRGGQRRVDVGADEHGVRQNKPWELGVEREGRKGGKRLAVAGDQHHGIKVRQRARVPHDA